VCNDFYGMSSSQESCTQLARSPRSQQARNGHRDGRCIAEDARKCGVECEVVWMRPHSAQGAHDLVNRKHTQQHPSPPLLTDLLPLVDVADEAGEAQQTQQAEDLGEADDAQGPGRPVHLRVQPGLQVHHQEDVVHRDGGHKVHQEPALQVPLADGPGGGYFLLNFVLMYVVLLLHLCIYRKGVNTPVKKGL